MRNPDPSAPYRYHGIVFQYLTMALYHLGHQCDALLRRHVW